VTCISHKIEISDTRQESERRQTHCIGAYMKAKRRKKKEHGYNADLHKQNFKEEEEGKYIDNMQKMFCFLIFEISVCVYSDSSFSSLINNFI